MKISRLADYVYCGFLSLWFGLSSNLPAQTNFTVTTPDFIYEINGVPPTGTPGFGVNNSQPLTVVAGNTYTFTMQGSSLHPMVIVTNSGGSPPDVFEYTNAAPQDVSRGIITLAIPPVNFPNTLYYQCDIHGFYGVITVLPPQASAPPRNQIISMTVSSNVVMFSTGTNTTYALIPQFRSNMLSGTWLNVPSYTNTFANGTNITIFDRLDPICGPNVFLRISQQPPP